MVAPREIPAVSEQLVRLVGMSARLASRAWVAAIGTTVLTGFAAALFLAFAGFVVAGVQSGSSRGGVGDFAATALVAAALALSLGIVLAGPLAAFTLARTHEKVGILEATSFAFFRAWRVATLVSFPVAPFIIATLYNTTAGLRHMEGRPDDGSEGAILLAMLVTWAGAPLYFMTAGLLGLAQVLASEEKPLRALRSGWALGRGHRALVVLSCLAVPLPIAAATGGAFTLGGRSMLLTDLSLLGGIAAAFLLAPLLAVAAHAVASGEQAE